MTRSGFMAPSMNESMSSSNIDMMSNFLRIYSKWSLFTLDRRNSL